MESCRVSGVQQQDLLGRDASREQGVRRHGGATAEELSGLQAVEDLGHGRAVLQRHLRGGDSDEPLHRERGAQVQRRLHGRLLREKGGMQGRPLGGARAPPQGGAAVDAVPGAQPRRMLLHRQPQQAGGVLEVPQRQEGLRRPLRAPGRWRRRQRKPEVEAGPGGPLPLPLPVTITIPIPGAITPTPRLHPRPNHRSGQRHGPRRRGGGHGGLVRRGRVVPGEKRAVHLHARHRPLGGPGGRGGRRLLSADQRPHGVPVPVRRLHHPGGGEVQRREVHPGLQHCPGEFGV